MKYFRPIFAFLVLLCMAGKDLPAQTDLSWKRLPDAPLNVTALASNGLGSVYMGVRGEGIYYAASQHEFPFWQRLGNKLSYVKQGITYGPGGMSVLSIVPSKTATGEVFTVVDAGEGGRLIFRLVPGSNGWVKADTGLLEIADPTQVMFDSHDNVFCLTTQEALQVQSR